jgi:hypothetical protein
VDFISGFLFYSTDPRVRRVKAEGDRGMNMTKIFYVWKNRIMYENRIMIHIKIIIKRKGI